ncbi:hypothetical protein PVK06_028741 [Gossypium arboreum]|uniref:Uncharacterized protein n=1 Tax=Gossypium arboreum TaxID=29729 RepID=A0ABR0P4P4_GOSAR|nr:hypothetical protein PVK06_028741 [Gossypium arboreum]
MEGTEEENVLPNAAMKCGSHCSDIAGDEKSCADTLQDHLDLDQGGERLSIYGVGVLIMHFIESTWKGLETLAPSTNFGPASFAPWKNSVELDKCSACDQWRYSHGAPISTPVPYVGT